MMFHLSLKHENFSNLIKSIKIGKHLPDSIYLHKDALCRIPASLNRFLEEVTAQLELKDPNWNVLKIHKFVFKITLLYYPSFFEDAYPTLEKSVTVDLTSGKMRELSFKSSFNPPILHRKELFVPNDHPYYLEFSEITQEGVNAGLYEDTKNIGFKKNWEHLIQSKGYQILDGRLFRKSSLDTDIHRYKTAISRSDFSAPIKCLGKHGYLDGRYTVFDYGCGRGDDLRELKAFGIKAEGWDPHFNPDSDIRSADIVNLGFVINVIEEKKERIEAIKKAYHLTDKLLVISAMIGTESFVNRYTPYKDGIITSRNTFQKYYTQAELKNFLEEILADPVIPISPGIFFVFKDKNEEQLFYEKRNRRHSKWETLSSFPKEKLDQLKLKIDENKDQVDQFWKTCLNLGRIPAIQEVQKIERLSELIGPPKKIFKVISNYYDTSLFKKAREERIEDLILYFALSHFGKNKPYKNLPDSLQKDVSEFFGSYSRAKERGLQELSKIANVNDIDKCCRDSLGEINSGLFLPHKSYTFHRKFLGRLPLLIRIYVGCAEKLFGDLDNIDLIKVHIGSHKCTFLKYDCFDSQSVPALKERVKVNLATQEISFFDYSGQFKPTALYNKSLFMDSSFLEYEKQRNFDARLMKILEGREPKNFEELNQALSEKDLEIKGFRFFTLRNETTTRV
ncbi:MAG: DNA phosphorothioation-associated putative methyltransferase [Oligoflexus sp.]